MRLSRMPAPLAWAAAAGGVAALGVLEATLFYRASPLIGIGAPIAVAVVVAVILRPQFGICAGLVGIPLEVLHASGGSFQLTPLKLLLLLSAGSIVLRALWGADRLRIDPAMLAYGAGLVWMAVGLATARDTAIVIRMLTVWTAFGIVALYVSNASPRQIRQILWAIVVSAAATSVLAIATGSTQEARDSATAVSGRATGSFTHPNQLAFFLVMSLPPALVLAMRGRLWPRVLSTGAVALIFTALLLTLTRGAIIGAGVSLAMMLVWAPFRRFAACVLVGLAIFAAANYGALSRSKEISLVGSRLATVTSREQATVNNGRLRIWSTVPQIVSDHPVFGLSLGNFHAYSLEYGLSEGGTAFEHAHNITLTVLAEQGIPGLTLFLLTLFLLLRKGALALRRRAHAAFPYALAAIAGLVGLFVNGLTDYPPGSAPNMAMIMVEIGVLIATVRHIQADAG